MRRYHRITTWLLTAAFCFGSLTPPSAQGFDYLKSIFKGPGPVAGKDLTVERLAQEIDWLERHIEQYGSVVCKQPDIWGQARLTKHRQEFEDVMAKQLEQFHLYINGTIARSDQAFFSNSFALQAAVDGRAAVIRNPLNPAGSTTLTSGQATSITNILPAPTVVTSGTAGTPQNPTIFATPPITMTTSQFGGFFAQGIALEPTLALDQQSRYIQHLHELRRINEGDDTADSPGYALNLVRIPVSILPGKATREGYGAETTITITPDLTDALLPTTFRNLVINDLVDQLALPITRLAEQRVWDDPARQKLKTLEHQWCLAKEKAEEASQQYQVAVKDKTKKLAPKLAEDESVLQTFANKYANAAAGTFDVLNAEKNDIEALKSALDNSQDVKSAKQRNDTMKAAVQKLDGEIDTLRRQIDDIRSTVAVVVGPSSRTRQAQNAVAPSQLINTFGQDELIAVAKTFGEGYQGRDVRWNGKPGDIVHLPDVQRYLQAELSAAYARLARPENRHLWCCLAPCAADGCDLAGDVRNGKTACLNERRNTVLCLLRGNHPNQSVPCKSTDCSPTDCSPNMECQPLTSTEALAWAILVEAALLNEHLIDDMKKVAMRRGGNCLVGEGLAFYSPEPDSVTCQAFNEYVRSRWPIHVFALDPVTQDQNLADAFSRRRELQLAASLAFVSGQISAANLSRFVRRLEADYETVALNRTVVGFSHGEDTFGWRFAPRFQTPPPAGTLCAFGQTLFGGPSPECELVQRNIEPGMRECVAVVIMPSFVPFVTLDVRTNWYRLNHHHAWLPTRHNMEPTMSDSMKLSRAIQSMHRTAAHICDAGNYRNGEVDRLLRRVDQLDHELPLQSMQVQVPIENTLGGFAMFSNGVTDLAPNLYGWYGGPGITIAKSGGSTASQGGGTTVQTPTALMANTNTISNNIVVSTATPATTTTGGTTASNPSQGGAAAGSTTLFLVGDHFSVHRTQVIAGDVEITQKQLLSRQIMQITIPGTVRTNTVDDKEYVDVHVATPYGVTAHLHIPALPPKDDKPVVKTGFAWKAPPTWYLCAKKNDCRLDVVADFYPKSNDGHTLNVDKDRFAIPKNETRDATMTLTLSGVAGSQPKSFDILVKINDKLLVTTLDDKDPWEASIPLILKDLDLVPVTDGTKLTLKTKLLVKDGMQITFDDTIDVLVRVLPDKCQSPACLSFTPSKISAEWLPQQPLSESVPLPAPIIPALNEVRRLDDVERKEPTIRSVPARTDQSAVSPTAVNRLLGWRAHAVPARFIVEDEQLRPASYWQPLPPVEAKNQ